MGNSVEELGRELSEIKLKVEAIYGMAFKNYTLALFGKRIGAEEKSKNIIQANFTVEKQLREIYRIIGTEYGYDADFARSIEERADDVLEYIVNSYDGVVAEIIGTSVCKKQVEECLSRKKKADRHGIDLIKIGKDNCEDKDKDGRASESTKNSSQNDNYGDNNILGISNGNDSSDIIINNDIESKVGVSIIGANLEAMEKFIGGA